MVSFLKWRIYFIGAAGGLIAGFVLLFAEYLVRRKEKQRESAEERIVRFVNAERRITGSIFNHLGPRSSIELMKSELGPPNKTTKEKIGLFVGGTDAEQEINAFVYIFKNADVKITSKDNLTINSLTVIAHYRDRDIAFNNLFNQFGEFFNQDGEEFLNVATLTPEILEECHAQEFTGCRDCFTAAQRSVGNPYYFHMTYFCDPLEILGDIGKNPQLLAGSVIHGLCLSAEPETASYIFISDML